MTPAVVSFTGADIETKNLNRRVYMPLPANWLRHQFNTGLFDDPDRKIEDWITNNLYGRWMMYYATSPQGLTIVIGFEEANDAVMFRLLDGDTAWLENTANVLL